MTITPEQAAALRKPFPTEVLGTLPQPYKKDSPKGNCGECGGYHGLPAMHLDFVGHAATTDRLLQVDPGWNWEPFATDANGLPMIDARGNLWIRLTVCGITRIGVGDGKSLKELIGDAIRNAAMRFGVALDLWSKDDLEQTSGEGATKLRAALAKPATAKQQPQEPPPERDESPAEGITDQQVKLLHIRFKEHGLDRDAALAKCTAILGRDVDTTKTLTKAETGRILDDLNTPSEATA